MNQLIQTDKNRNYGIDLLRITAMYMVVVLHVLGVGGILAAAWASPVNYWVAWALEIAAYGAVDIYALISGFVGYRVKHRYAGIVELWLRVLFYSVSFTLVDRLFFDPSMSKKDIFLSFFPLTNGGWWYFTMYCALFMFVPLMNSAIGSLQRKRFRNVLVSLIFVFSVLPFLWNKDIFQANDGYSVIWLAVLYLAGAYVGKYGVFEKTNKTVFLFGYVGCCVVTLLSMYVLQRRFSVFAGVQNSSGWLVRYTSLPVFLSALCLLLLFRDLDLPAFVKKAVAAIAPLTFCVYIIHLAPLIKDRLIRDRYAAFAAYPPAVMALAALGTAAVIFLACALLDHFRAGLFSLLRVKERLNRAEEKWRKRLNDSRGPRKT